MKLTVTITDQDGAAATHEMGTLYDGVLVIVVKRSEDGSLAVDSHEPLDVDDHPDTLQQIGSRVVRFAQGR